jgi:diacylglycerol O-acyltransferase / wax synthase
VTPERLSGLDAGFLYLETPTLQMHVAIVAVFDPTTVPGGYSFRRIRQRILDRIPLVPVFQRRLVEVPLRLGHPVWVDDADFDIDNHLRRAALPSPGGMRELAEFAADVTSRQLPRDRPLWEMWLVEGLEDGKFALVAKMHHSTIDGVSGAELLGVLFDLEPEPPDQGPQGERQLDLRVPSGLELVSHALLANLVRPLGMGRTVWRTTQSIADVRKVRQAVRPGGSGTGKAAIPLSAPRTSLNGSVHARRRVAFAAANLADVKKLKNAMGTTVNDVVLAICTGAVRTYLLAGDELPGIPLVALVPVSVTPETAELKGSNKISGMFVQLPCELDDPLERLRFIREGTKGAKEEHQALGAGTLQNWAEHAAPNVFAAAARLYTRMRLADRHRPLANLIISNVPGPDVPLYMGGSQLLGMFPLGPVMDGMGLNITIMSYQGVLYWGLAADARAVPRIWDIAAAIPAALSDLLEAAGLDEDPFDVPLHVGPGMPAAARWIRGGAGTGAAAERVSRQGETDLEESGVEESGVEESGMEESDMSKAAIA